MNVPATEIIFWKRRMTAWIERKRLLKAWRLEAEAAGDNHTLRLIEVELARHNKAKPDEHAEAYAASVAYRRRRAAVVRIDTKADARFAEIDRLMRQRRGVDLSPINPR